MRRIWRDRGTRSTGRTNAVQSDGRSERGALTVLFALLLPLILILSVVVVDVGNWWVHQKHLQTKVDAAAFAGGGSWGFPCGSDIDANIEAGARMYVGEHMKADGTAFTATTFNPQVGGTPGSQIHVVLNGFDWWDDDAGMTPADGTSPLNSSLCDSKTLDVKATEANNSPLFGFLPFFPDIKRKARVEIQEVAGLTGLLPIAVRLPQPLSAAAVFYDEASRTILDVRYFRQVCTDGATECIFGAPPGLGQWTTHPAADDPEGSWASFPVAATTGVVLATSVRPACGAGDPPAGQPCLEDSAWVGDPIDEFCRQASGTVRCFDADGVGSSQAVNSGVHFIRGYATGDVGSGRPEARGAWLENVDCPANGYFNSASSTCFVKLTVVVDIGSNVEDPPPDPPDDLVETRIADHVEVRYCLARTGETSATVCDTQFGVGQDLQCTGGPGEVTCSSVIGTHPRILAASRENAFAIQVRLRRTSVDGFPDCTNDPDSEYHNLCRWFFTAAYVDPNVPPTGQQILDAPIQRSFMGDIERTTPLKWLRLTVDEDCNLLTFDDRIVDFDAASQPTGSTPCYVVDMGTAGGLARDQDEPPIAFNLGNNSSQRAYVDCDPNIQPDPREEIVQGCQWPSYAANRFDRSPFCPGVAGFWDVPKPEPFDNWPPFRCVLTQTGNADQVIQGFNKRIFGRTNKPMCPGDDMTQYVKGRNYWHRDNNDYDDETFAWGGDGDPIKKKGNTLRSDDPRLVTLFFTSYDSFTGTGNQVYPIVGFGNFYVTGYGETRTGTLFTDDPCSDGNDGDLYNGNGNEPPPDLDYSSNTRWVWGHFVKDVTPGPFTTGGSGVLCNPEASFQPCVAVLVE